MFPTPSRGMRRLLKTRMLCKSARVEFGFPGRGTDMYGLRAAPSAGEVPLPKGPPKEPWRSETADALASNAGARD